MEISSKGAVPATLEDYIKKWTNYLKAKYGNDFFIKKEGVIDNLAVGSSEVAMDFEEVLLFIIKQMNPYTAEDDWQDKLYSLIGLDREQSSFTIVQRTVQGQPNNVAPAGSILFKNKTTEDQFKLIDDCQIGEDGTGVGSFKAIEFGSIDLPTSALCELITAPPFVNGIYYTDGNTIDIGKDYQDDAEFRETWLQEQSKAKATTEGGLRKVLLPYCFNNSKNINIRMNRNIEKFSDIPLHSANIVLNSPYDDETLAKVIFNKMVDGAFGLVGKIKQVVTDSEGVQEDVYFTRAEKITIYLQIFVSLEENFNLFQVQENIKNAIKEQTQYTMGEDVIANKFIKIVDSIKGVDYVKSLKVSTNNSTWKDIINISDVQLAVIGEINVSD